MEQQPNVSGVYASISDEVRAANKDLKNLPGGAEFSNKFMTAFFKKNCQRKDFSEVESEYKYKKFFLENKKRVKGFKRQPGKRKILTAGERKRLKLFDIKPELQRYSMYLPLHELWKDYICDVINFDKIAGDVLTQTESKLLRADYHGAIMTVARSKCPSLVGFTGIVVQETKNTFNIITKDDQMKTVPKQNSVFSLVHKGFVFTIYGNQFCVRPSDRVTKKFKTKPTIDL